MKKNHCRDYVTEAFRLYARLGGAAAYKTKIWNEAIEKRNNAVKSGLCAPTEGAVLRAEQALSEKAAVIADLEAVERTFEILKSQSDEAVKAVVNVYMCEAHKDINRGDISKRVQKVTLWLHVDVSTVYRYLAYARDIFACERGLRANKE